MRAARHGLTARMAALSDAARRAVTETGLADLRQSGLAALAGLTPSGQSWWPRSCSMALSCGAVRQSGQLRSSFLPCFSSSL